MGNIQEKYVRYKAEKEAQKMREGMPQFGGSSEEKKNQRSRSSSSSSSSSNKEKNEQKPNFFSRLRSKSQKKTDSNYAKEIDEHKPLTIQADQTLRVLGASNRSFIKGETIYEIIDHHASYQGQFQKKVPHGKGIAHFRDGSYYSGDFANGEAEGQGLYIFRTGTYYEGGFRASKFSGYGTMNYLNKSMIYRGNWIDGLPEGEGVQQTKQTTYNGFFSRGDKNGTGQYRWANGNIYRGQFRDGLMHGDGILYNGNGDVLYEGSFLNGKKSGKGLLQTSTGSYYGDFNDDYLNGDGSFVWKDGKVYQGEFVNTKMQGRGKIYYPNGQIAEGNWDQNHSRLLTSIDNDSSKAKDKIEDILKLHRARASSPNKAFQHNSSYKQQNNIANNSYNSNNSNNKSIERRDSDKEFDRREVQYQ